MTEEQNQEESPASRVERFFREIDIPTKADLERVFTNEELTELCTKHKCRVDMWKFNIVNDYREVFTKTGRYQRWPEKLRLKMLAHAVNKKKPKVLYDDAVIAQFFKKEHEMQIKENILSLNYWKRLREEKLEEENTGNRAVASEDITNASGARVGSDIQPELEDVLNISPEAQEIDQQPGAPNVFANINTESMTINSEFWTQSQDVVEDYNNFDEYVPMTSTQSQKADL